MNHCDIQVCSNTVLHFILETLSLFSDGHPHVAWKILKDPSITTNPLYVLSVLMNGRTLHLKCLFCFCIVSTLFQHLVCGPNKHWERLFFYAFHICFYINEVLHHRGHAEVVNPCRQFSFRGTHNEAEATQAVAILLKLNSQWLMLLLAY